MDKLQWLLKPGVQVGFVALLVLAVVLVIDAEARRRPASPPIAVEQLP